MPVEDTDRWNFRVFLGQGILRSTADEMSSARLVLPFLYSSFGGPPWLAGMLMPITTIGKLAAQLIGAPIIDRARTGKWYLAVTTLVSALALVIVSLFTGALAPAGMATLFAFISILIGLGNGIGSLTFQDMLGRVLSVSFRGSLLFTTSAAAGVVTIGVAALTNVLWSDDSPAQTVHIQLLWISVALFVCASIAVLAIREAPKAPRQRTAAEASSRGAGYAAELAGGLRLIFRLPWFRRYLIGVFLFLSIELVVPFAAIHAARFHADTTISLSLFVVSASVGMILSGVVWPRVIRKSIRLELTTASLVSALALSIGIIAHAMPTLQQPVTHGLIFCLLTIAGLGVLNGRTVYLVGAANDSERPFCVAVTNLLAGGTGLILALIVGSISHVSDIILGLAFLLCMNIAAAIYARTLPDVKRPEATGGHSA